MRRSAWVLGCCLLANGGCQSKAGNTSSTKTKVHTQAELLDNEVVEASCGQCQLGLPGDACDLAVRIGGKPYFVEGSSIDGHGDAHAGDGLCNCIRHAKVSGAIHDGKFAATAFELLPMEE